MAGFVFNWSNGGYSSWSRTVTCVVLFLSELIVQEGLNLVGAELYGELEDDEEEKGLQRPVKGDEALLKAVEPALAEAMNKHGEEQYGYPQGALCNEGGDALGVKLGKHPAEIACGRVRLHLEATQSHHLQHIPRPSHPGLRATLLRTGESWHTPPFQAHMPLSRRRLQLRASGKHRLIFTPNLKT